ncbi:hypothetical protein IDH44_25765 [Paenibacillus sp. IB182496]|uniref:DUF3153 domain-containing protein n=1 Tax=Paenibacillus sabuli TaxID=2772509 RepID=A0A927BZ83_9BACL|nr:hypothetical protein [Paenibacillus sabuli]MBD2848601.1 hypothetical protein [Paenibacillus sabuli]
MRKKQWQDEHQVDAYGTDGPHGRLTRPTRPAREMRGANAGAPAWGRRQDGRPGRMREAEADSYRTGSMRSRVAPLLAALTLMLVLAGCAGGGAQVDIHRDGSGDLQMRLELDEHNRWLPLETIGEGVDELARRWELQAEQSTEDGMRVYRLSRHVDDLRALSLGDSDMVTVKDRWLYTVYAVRAELDVQEQLGPLAADRLVPEMLLNMMLRQFDFDVTLSLPIPPLSHNANRADGGKLSWDLSLTRPNVFELEVAVPHIGRLAAVLGGLLAALLGLWLWRRSRKRKRRGQG